MPMCSKASIGVPGELCYSLKIALRKLYPADDVLSDTWTNTLTPPLEKQVTSFLKPHKKERHPNYRMLVESQSMLWQLIMVNAWASKSIDISWELEVYL